MTAQNENAVIARVEGQVIHQSEKKQLNSIILRVLLEQYAIENGLTPTKSEIHAYLNAQQNLERQNRAELQLDLDQLTSDLEDSDLSTTQRTQIREPLEALASDLSDTSGMDDYLESPEMEVMKEELAAIMIQSWKVNQSLYQKYGGRVLLQDAIPEPVDAIEKFLMEMHQQKKFTIVDVETESEFWEPFQTTLPFATYHSDPQTIERLFQAKPWR